MSFSGFADVEHLQVGVADARGDAAVAGEERFDGGAIGCVAVAHARRKPADREAGRDPLYRGGCRLTLAEALAGHGQGVIPAELKASIGDRDVDAWIVLADEDLRSVGQRAGSELRRLDGFRSERAGQPRP